MENSNVSRKSLSRIVLSLTAVSVLIGLLVSSNGTPTAAESTAAATESPATAQPTPIEARLLANWHLSLPNLHVPGPGCYTITYPGTAWQPVQCATVPPARQLLALPPAPAPTTGNADTESAQAPGLFINSATGSFQSVTGVGGEAGSYNGGAVLPDTYTLQLNTGSYSTSYCSTCTVQVQFIFGSQPGNTQPMEPNQSIFMMYFVANSSRPCPTTPGTWQQFGGPPPAPYFCIGSTDQTPLATAEPIGNLAHLRLYGSVIADQLIFYDNGATAGMVQGSNFFPPAAGSGWNIAEFNVLGNGNAGQAMFTPAPSVMIVPRVQLDYVGGGTARPGCMVWGASQETNNLGYATSAPTVNPPPPAHGFIEVTGGGAPNCAYATDIGDTHLNTFNGLLYDFQAAGDFVLAQRGNDFVVQTRQVSGAPNWPNAAVNQAVALRIGKHKVALCPTTTGLNVDGKKMSLDDGKSLAVPDRVRVTRTGNAYVITGPTGDSVRAVVNTAANGETWIDVFVGLGAWPAQVSGLIANAHGDANTLQTRDGIVLTRSFAFNDLYGRYANSWSVKPGESLLTDCGEQAKLTVPAQPFHAADLLKDKNPDTVQKAKDAQALCSKLGVKPGPLLEACTLDVVVIGSDKAANVFVGLPAPVAVDGVVNNSK